MFKIMFVFLIVSLQLMSQHTEPEIVSEQKIKVEDNEFQVWPLAKFVELNGKLYIIYNLTTISTYENYSGIASLSENHQITNQFEYRNLYSTKTRLRDVITINDIEYLYYSSGGYISTDEGYIDISFPMLTTLEGEQSIGDFYSGDTKNKNMNGYFMASNNEYIYFLTNKEIYIQDDTLRKWFVEKYDS